MKKIKIITIFILSFSTIANASPYSKALRYEESSNSDYREIYSGVWSIDNIDSKNFNSEKSGDEIYPGIWRKESKNIEENSLEKKYTKENNINIINRGGNISIDKENKNEKKINTNSEKKSRLPSNINTSINKKSEIINEDSNDDILNILK